MGRKFVSLRKPRIAYHAKNGITHGRQNPVRIVLHDTESHDAAGIVDIKGVYDFWQTQGYGYGAHFIVDGDGHIGQGASCRDEMWHVGNFNGGSVGIEQIGYASYTTLIWSSKRRAQLRSVAKLLAFLHQCYGIPLQVPSDIRTQGGVVTHKMVGEAGIDPSGHTDPGARYPLRFVLWLARRFVNQGGWYVRT